MRIIIALVALHAGVLGFILSGPLPGTGVALTLLIVLMLLRAERAQHEREDPKEDHDAASLTEVVLESGILIVAMVGLAACTYDAWRM